MCNFIRYHFTACTHLATRRIRVSQCEANASGERCYESWEQCPLFTICTWCRLGVTVPDLRGKLPATPPTSAGSDDADVNVEDDDDVNVDDTEDEEENLPPTPSTSAGSSDSVDVDVDIDMDMDDKKEDEDDDNNDNGDEEEPDTWIWQVETKHEFFHRLDGFRCYDPFEADREKLRLRALKMAAATKEESIEIDDDGNNRESDGRDGLGVQGGQEDPFGPECARPRPGKRRAEEELISRPRKIMRPSRCCLEAAGPTPRDKYRVVDDQCSSTI